MEKQSKNRGFRRIWHAIGYSFSGLQAALRTEAAFREEALLFVLLLPVLVLLPVSSLIKIVLLLVNTLVLIVELLNSAIEAVVDKASPEVHHLAKRAKDMGSAAVLLCLLVAGITWIIAICSATW